MKRFSKLALVLMIAALALVGCGTKPADKDGDVKITYWNFPNFVNDKEFTTSEEFDAALIKAFEDKNPGIKVEYQKLDFTDGPAKIETAIQTKTNPDVIYDAPGRIIDWASKGYLVPFDEVDKSKLQDPGVRASSHDGKLYLYPQGLAPFLMAVNTKLTDELKVTDLLPLDRPDRNWTVDEFETFLRAVKDAEGDTIPTVLYSKSAAGDQGPRAFVSNLFGSWITNDDVTEYIINNEEGVKGLEWIAKATAEGLLGSGVSLEAADSTEYFRSGKSALTILSSPGLLAGWQNDEALDAKFLPFPNDKKSPKFEYLVAGPAVFDNGNDAQAEAAKKFVDFMINDDVWGERALLASGNFSAKKGATGLYDKPELVFAESLTEHFGPYYNTIPGYAKMRPTWFPMLQSVMGGEVAPQKAADDFVEAANKTITE